MTSLCCRCLSGRDGEIQTQYSHVVLILLNDVLIEVSGVSITTFDIGNIVLGADFVCSPPRTIAALSFLDMCLCQVMMKGSFLLVR